MEVNFLTFTFTEARTRVEVVLHYKPHRCRLNASFWANGASHIVLAVVRYLYSVLLQFIMQKNLSEIRRLELLHAATSGD